MGPSLTLLIPLYPDVEQTAVPTSLINATLMAHTPVTLETPGFPIGLSDEAYCERSVHLAAGDRLYLYSDGLTETINSGGEAFGDARLREAIGRESGNPLRQGIDSLLTEILRWHGGDKLQDDISILAVEVAGAPEQLK
jgi:phosphoserine phosphatase RsbU/P